MIEGRFRFAFVSNALEIGGALKRMADPKFEDVVSHSATMEDAVPVARNLLSDGIDVILGGGGTGSLLAQTLGQPVVKISRSYLDVVRALVQARAYGDFIALTNFHEPLDGSDLFEELLGIRIRQIVFDGTDDLERGIAAAVSEGANCIVGSGVCKKIAAQHDCAGVMVSPGDDAIMRSLREARALAVSRRKERREFLRVNAILDEIKDGLIVVSATGELEFANSAARELLSHIDHAFTAIRGELGFPEVLKTRVAQIDRVCKVAGRVLIASVFPIQVNKDVDGAVATFKDAARVHRMERQLKEEVYLRGFVAKHVISDIKGSSEAIARVLGDLRDYATTDVNLLIEGETGVGKELFAQSVHNLSRRHAKPFVAVNCSALSESLLETELFGYEEGAFTGALRGGKMGLFELAQGGTLFLDEIADVSLNMQAKLLRVLEEKEIMRVGGSRIVRVDARVLCSTYKNLYVEVRSRKFRNDLYFRLATLHIAIPPLRARLIDIPPLVHDALHRNGRPMSAISDQMLQRLSEYEWPGNVRELETLLQRYSILLGNRARDDALLERLLSEMRESIETTGKDTNSDIILKTNGSAKLGGLRERLSQYERELIAETLRACRYNKQDTAKKLGISVNTLWRKIPRDQKH